MQYLHDILSPNRVDDNWPAITSPKIGTKTYGQLREDVERSAQTLAPFAPGNSHVAIMLGNRYDAIVDMLACSMTHNPFIPLNPNIKIHKLKEIIKDSPVSVIIATNSSVFGQHEEEIVDITEANRKLPDNPMSARIAALLYTSGSTGKPKGVMCPHDAMIAAIVSINQYLKHGKDDTIVTTLPLSHGYGLYQVLTGLAAGSHIVLEPGFTFAQPILKRIQQVQATGFAVVPTMLNMIFKVNNWPKYLYSLRYITNAGAALPPNYNLKLRQNLKFTTHIIPMHGLTECVRTLYMPPDIGDVPLDAVGVPIPGMKAHILDGNMETVTKGEVGELVISGPNVMAGYWGKPEETEQTFKKFTDTVFLKTGDLFKQDTNRGYYYFVGRKDDMVKVRGERVAPKEVEDMLYQIPNVNEAVVIPIVDPKGYYETYFLAHIASEVEMTKNEVLKWCKQNLEPHLIPKDVVFWSELPRNENGKIDRQHLKQGLLI